jgi:hypothetical protein
MSDLSASHATDDAPRVQNQQPPDGGGFAALIRRMRQAVEDIDMDD